MKTVTYSLAMVLLLSLIFTGCGRKGPLEAPPDENRDAEQSVIR
ncbi:MAG: lipoprotein [Rhodospirillales bacterium]|nr:lipoprotein [Rhodospirillales bacterium]